MNNLPQSHTIALRIAGIKHPVRFEAAYFDFRDTGPGRLARDDGGVGHKGFPAGRPVNARRVIGDTLNRAKVSNAIAPIRPEPCARCGIRADIGCQHRPGLSVSSNHGCASK